MINSIPPFFFWWKMYHQFLISLIC